MSKPSIFFSHSSKDKKQLLELRNSIDVYTGGTLNIFMSSDGESIPFGRNWVHRIEEGLTIAKIMFVFVTPTSVKSNWIYFEAGFAYSKGIEVIPVGIGIDVGLLKAPLNLLQGFNLNSKDALNNFIAIINKKFDYNFKENFTENDYKNIVTKETSMENDFDLSETFNGIDYIISQRKYNDKTNFIERNLDKIFDDIIIFLDSEATDYSYHEQNGERTLLIAGIKIRYIYSTVKPKNSNFKNVNSRDRIEFYFSSYNFSDSIRIFNNLMNCFEDVDSCFLRFSLCKGYEYIARDEDISSLIYKDDDSTIDVDKQLGVYGFRNLKYSIYKRDRWNDTKVPDYVLSVVFEQLYVNTEELYDLFDYLLKKGVIKRVY